MQIKFFPPYQMQNSFFSFFLAARKKKPIAVEGKFTELIHVDSAVPHKKTKTKIRVRSAPVGEGTVSGPQEITANIKTNP